MWSDCPAFVFSFLLIRILNMLKKDPAISDRVFSFQVQKGTKYLVTY